MPTSMIIKPQIIYDDQKKTADTVTLPLYPKPKNTEYLRHKTKPTLSIIKHIAMPPRLSPTRFI